MFRVLNAHQWREKLQSSGLQELKSCEIGCFNQIFDLYGRIGVCLEALLEAIQLLSWSRGEGKESIQVNRRQLLDRRYFLGILSTSLSQYCPNSRWFYHKIQNRLIDLQSKDGQYEIYPLFIQFLIENPKYPRVIAIENLYRLDHFRDRIVRIEQIVDSRISLGTFIQRITDANGKDAFVIDPYALELLREEERIAQPFVM